jgi:alcohol dehydrogenase
VCSTANVELVVSLRADTLIDYTKEDFLKDGHVYDVVFDAAGKISRALGKRALRAPGKYLTIKAPRRRRPSIWSF